MAALTDLINQVEERTLRERLLQEAARLSKQKKFGLVFEEHIPECTPLYNIPIRRGSNVAKKAGSIDDIYMVIKLDGEIAVCLQRATSEVKEIPLNELVTAAQFGEPIFPSLTPIAIVENAPDDNLWHTLIEADNYHALQLLEYLYPKQVDCIYIDPPYNTGARDWKYNNNYVDSADAWRHSKWLSMMEKRLRIAKRILNPKDSVLIVTIDEKEYLHLGCLLEEMFPTANMQMVSSVTNSRGVSRGSGLARTDEYIYILQLGSSAVNRLPLSDEWRVNVKEDKRVTHLRWSMLIRSGSHFLRADSKNQFYPIFVKEDGKAILSVGEPYYGEDRNEVVAPKGTVAIWPIRRDGNEGNWQISAENLRELMKKGYVRLGKFSDIGMPIYYLKKGEINKVESGVYEVSGHREDGSIISDTEVRALIPGTQWRIASHDASTGGTNLLKTIFGNSRFTYPKSLYAEADAIRLFVANKPNALVVDFFAGSGTTLHAVNLLNAEDGGHRRCILVTNNEVAESEASEMGTTGLQPGDEDWEKHGICRAVTWPRTEYSILGKRGDGTPLEGEYFTNQTVEREENRVFHQIGFIKDAAALSTSAKKQLVAMLKNKDGKGQLPQSLVKSDSKFIVSENHTASILFDSTHIDEYLEALQDQDHITEFYIVATETSVFNLIKSQITDLLGPVMVSVNLKRPMSEGFPANCEYFKLSFLDKNDVALGKQFKEILPLLWLKAGAVGKRPELDGSEIPDMLILPQNRMAVLTNECGFMQFEEKLDEHQEIKTVFIVTDSERAYREMILGLKAQNTYQLYRDYLDNFRINARR